MFAVIADQKKSRSSTDAVASILRKLEHESERGAVRFELAPERTSGDEFEFLASDPLSVYRVLRLLIEDGRWHVGIGVGDVELPLPGDVREARGDALIRARRAVEVAKGLTPSVQLVVSDAPVSPRAPGGAPANTVLALVAELLERRLDTGWQAVAAIEDPAKEKRPMSEVADSLGISRQALSNRLKAANWVLEQRSVPVLVSLLEQAERMASSSAVTKGD